jgi:hypothetical protein
MRIPRHCLKREEENWFLLRWIAKRKKWEFYQIHFLVAEMVQEQQRFLNQEFGNNSTFDKLFCWLTTAPRFGVKNNGYLGRFDTEPIYRPEVLSHDHISNWLKAFSKVADLRTKDDSPFVLQSHMFRRTKASIMAYCEAEDEYMAAVLGHASLDMLSHYRKRSLERLEAEAKTKSYVDMYGRITTFKPRKRRYERLTNLLKVSTPLGECHRPTMLGDCQYRYACLSCDHHRITMEDRKQLESDQLVLLQDLSAAQAVDQQRRVVEISRLLELVNNRLKGLDELKLFTRE